jgi:hypothetical protein
MKKDCSSCKKLRMKNNIDKAHDVRVGYDRREYRAKKMNKKRIFITKL